MTIYTIYNNYGVLGGNKTLSPTFLEQAPVLQSLPDTALLKDGRPFFVPDFADPCSFRASLVVRISRLGRSVPVRFARRYYDAVTAGVAFMADNLLARCREASLPWDVCCGFDSAAAVGDFLPLPADQSAADMAFELCLDGEVVQAVPAGDANFSVEEIIAYISQFHMLRQGDLIFTGFPCAPTVACLDTRLTASLCGTPVLGFNVK